MQLRITKNTGKPHLLVYQRDDGSNTWMKTDDFFVRHDLSHYALEKTLGYRTAFMGMLNNGMVLADSFIDMGTAVAPVRLSPEQLTVVRTSLIQLLTAWIELPVGQIMILDLDLQTK